MAQAEAGLELPIGITEQKFMQQLARIEARAIKTSKGMERNFVAANSNVAKSFNGMSNAARGQLQNVSFQLQDIFVQISSGTSAARALGQQLPQLLGGFGAFGAVLGLVASAAIPLAANFLGAKDEAEDLSKSIDNLQSSVSAYRDAIAAANAPTEELIEKYGRATGAARELLEQLSGLQRLEALSALSNSMTGVVESFGGIREAVALANQELERVAQFGDSAASFDALNKQMVAGFGLAIPQARELVALLSDAQSAKSVEEKAEAMSRLSGFLNDAVNSSDNVNAALLAAARAAAEGSLAAFDLADATRDAEAAADGVASAASGIAPVIDEASAAASNLTGNLQAAMATLNGLVAGVSAAQRQALATANIKLQTVGNPTERAARLSTVEANEKTGLGAYQAIRTGNTSALADMATGADTIAEGARQVAAAEEAVSAAEAAYQKTVNASSGGGRSGGGRKRSGGGGGGGRSARQERPFFENIEKDLTDLQRQIDLVGKSSEEVAKLKATWELLDEAKKRGIKVDENLNAQIDAQAQKFAQLTGELERNEIAQQRFDDAIDGIAGAMSNALIAGESLKDGLKQVFAQIAADIISSDVKNLISGLFNGAGGGGGGIGGFISSLLGGKRAGGGPVRAGTPYLVNENTPNSEIFVPSTSGGILNVRQAQEALRGGSRGGSSAPLSVNLSIDLRGTTGDKALDQKIAAAGQAILAQVPETMANHNKRRG